MELEFFGAAGEVTGSCHIVRAGGRQLLLDCGMIQGGRDAPERNRRGFPFLPQAIDAVVLSHAHIDHCGRLPLLVKRGYRGPIHTNAACRDLLPILLHDTAELAARDAERANRHRERGEPLVEPLFTAEHVDQVLRQVHVQPYDRPVPLLAGFTLRLREAGHILGSSCVELWVEEGAQRRKLVFSGDLGQYGSPILLDPHDFGDADVVLMESTYGDRLHRDRAETEKELGGVIAAAAQSQGNIVVPAFAIGRSQELLYVLGRHQHEWNLSRWQIFLDSPMAIEASKVYWNHPERYDAEARHLRGDFNAMPVLQNLRLTRTPEESRSINELRSHAFVIAGSGMCNGGRILHHLRHNLARPECHVVITGFQAPGTLGRAIVDREPFVRIYGQSIRVAASVHTLGGFSAHGDQADLLRWYRGFQRRPPVYLVHGEPSASAALARRLEADGAQVTLAQAGMKLDLTRVPGVAVD